MFKRLIPIWLILMLILPSTVSARQTGSISLTMHCESEAVPGGKITLYEVTHLTQWQQWDEEKIAEYVSEMSIAGITKEVDRYGKVEFSGLEKGVFLIAQTEPAEGYLTMKPFLVALPLQMNGEETMEVAAAPKIQKIPGESLPQTGQRIWSVWIMTCSGILLIGCGILIGRKE